MVRSLLFAPANRRELVLKFPRVPADCFVIDLEDGTPPREKVAARDALPALVRELRSQSLNGLLYIRVNEISSSQYSEDLAAVKECEVDGVVLPKIEHAADIHSLIDIMDDGRTEMRVIGGIESMEGVLNVSDYTGAHDRLVGFYFGAEDFAADMGIERSLGSEEVAYARSRVVLAARARGKFVVDQAVPQIRDLDQFRRDAEKGKSLGYTGKICITPQQVELSNSVFSPSEQEVDESLRLMKSYEEGMRAGGPMIIFEGKVVVPEGPLVKRARRIIELSQLIREKVK